jgi:hypothetical protein
LHKEDRPGRGTQRAFDIAGFKTMQPPHFVVRHLLVASTAVALASCASLPVNLYHLPGANFREYRTYDWASEDQPATGDAELDASAFLRERLRTHVEERLSARSLERTMRAPDLRVHYHVSVGHRLEISGPGEREGYCFDCRPPFVFARGTLILDFIDARTNTLVWRGWTEGSLDGDVHDEVWMERRIGKAVACIVSKLPRDR